MKKIKAIMFLISCFLCVVSSAQKTKTIYVADRTVFRAGTECLQLKEKEKGDWNLYVDSISGFAYQEGYEYKLKAKSSKSGVAYTFVKLLSKKKTGYNPATKLEGKRWVIMYMHDNGHFMDVPDTSYLIRLDISKGIVHGHAVCNNLKGAVKVEGDHIFFSNIGFTKKKCEESNETMEKIIAYMLEHAKTYKLTGNKLTLTSTADTYINLIGD